MQRDTNRTPRCHVMKWSIRKQRQHRWEHRNMEKRLEWQKHRCLRKDILTVALVVGGGAVEVSVDASELRGDHSGAGWWTLKRATHRLGLLPGVILWLLGKLQNTPSCCYRNKQFRQHGDTRPEKEANRKKQTLLSQYCVFYSCHWWRRPESSRWGGHDARSHPHSWVRKSRRQQL